MSTRVLEKRYSFKEIEEHWGKFWLERGYFKPKLDSRPKYCVTIPPPNVTGSLHMGHALNGTLQDIMVRFHRMLGYDVVWFMGTDHAGIATQTVVEKHLLRKGIKRDDLTREEFLKAIWEWKEKYGNVILEQFKRLGFSGYYEMSRFTMDEKYTRAVLKAFVHLYNKGYVYKGKRVVNWCPRCLTSLSDLEVEFKEVRGKLWYIRYPGVDFDGDIIIATTRPETMLADTAVAVNPNDERYRHLIGKHVKLPLVGRTLEIIADEAVSPEFGTGALKVTPGHDFTDAEIGQRHNLEVINVFTPTAHINENAPKAYVGLDRYEAREAILRDLREGGYLVREEDYELVLGTCYRCGTPLEPYLSDQWFIRMDELAKPAIDVVERDLIRFHPPKFKEVYLNWMRSLRDWCVSRQLVWGHRIPIYTCENCGYRTALEQKPDHCLRCGSTDITQEQDVLDTWFSSALWPFAVQGWPEDDKYLKHFYPTDIMVTAREILYLWVARMVMMSLEFMGTIPFKDVIIHAVILHPSGKRMSKSLGTGIDPLELIDKYGADSTRLGLIIQVGTTQDIKFSYEKIEMARNFINKLWNAARFIQVKTGNTSLNPEPNLDDPLDRWILYHLDDTVETVTQAIKSYRFFEAAMKLYEFTWNKFCDWYLESVKVDPDGVGKHASTLQFVLMNILKLLHPFAPFVTEHLWQAIGYNAIDESITISKWPAPIGADPVNELEVVIELIRDARTLKHETGIPNQVPNLAIETDKLWLQSYLWLIQPLAKVKVAGIYKPGSYSVLGTIPIAKPDYTLHLELTEEQMQLELNRLRRELEQAESKAQRLRDKLANPAFLQKAPQHVIEKFRADLQATEELIGRITSRLSKLQGALSK